MSTLYKVELTDRAVRDLRRLFETIGAEESTRARAWFAALERKVLGLENYPRRGATILEDMTLRHVMHGRKPDIYRIIYRIDEVGRRVVVVHIRHGARDAMDFG